MPSKVSSRQSLPPGSGKGESLAKPSPGIVQTATEIIPAGKNQPGGAKRKREATGKSTDKSRGQISKKAKTNTKVNEEEEKATVIGSRSQILPKAAQRSTKVKTKEKELVHGRDESSKGLQTSLAKTKSKAAIKQEPVDIGDEEEDRDSAEGDPATPKKAKRKRKTKEEKEAEAMPIAARTTGLRMFVGAHVSSAKGWSQRSNKEIGLCLMRCELK